MVSGYIEAKKKIIGKNIETETRNWLVVFMQIATWVLTKNCILKK